MKSALAVTGYPLSQLLISGGIAGISASPVVALAATGRPIPLVAIFFAGGMGAFALVALLANPIVRLAVESLLGSLKDIEAVHIEDVIEALGKPAGKTIGLPSGINFTVEYNRYVLSPDSLALCPFPALKGEVKLEIPGKMSLGGWEVKASVISPNDYQSLKDESNDFSGCFDLDKSGINLTVRSRLPGDRFQQQLL